MKKTTSLLILLLSVISLIAQDNGYVFKKDVPYVSSSETDAYKLERCKLDIYYPEGKTDLPVIVWFHGGGLEVGAKDLPDELKNKNVIVVSANYRLSPKAKNPAYIEDAAEATAWVFKNIQQYGGNPDRIYVSGHSAGGYLALMVGLDKSYLQKYDIDADKIKGLAPISGQTNTHYTIRKERGIPDNIPIIDAYAPINQSRKDIPNTILITGGRYIEMTARYEENAHLDAVLRSLGNNNVKLYELEGFDHGSVRGPGCYLLIDMIRRDNK
ncbi:MAG: alpha/beta hydrolase fold domain-containing protein [Prevotella sp.]|jgi:predicted peptidase|nr:alpha/beta hydrolase fold domain-containing protein [Prevotella sp.]